MTQLTYHLLHPSWVRIFLFCGLIFFSSDVAVFAAEEEKAIDWTTSYAMILLFISLAAFIVVRTSRREDTALSIDEQRAEKEAQLEKAKKKSH